LVERRAPNVYRGSLVILIAQARCVLGDYAAMAHWARKLFAERSAFPFTPASFRLDPRFSTGIDAPEIQTLLKEFASLDQPANAATATAISEKSLVVLPLENLSPEPENAFFTDGMHAE